MKKRSLIFFFMGMGVCGEAQFAAPPAIQTAWSVAAYSRKMVSPFSWQTQAAALASYKNFAAGFGSEKRYGIREWQSGFLSAAMPSAFGVWGLRTQIQRTGDWSFAQYEFAFGRAIGKKADIGVAFTGQHAGIKGYAAQTDWSGRAGVIFHPTEQFQTGIAIDNPAGGRSGNRGWVNMPLRWTWGCGYDASPRFFTGFEIVKTKGEAPGIQAALIYSPVSRLRIHTSLSTLESAFAGGVSFQFHQFWITVHSSFHAQLGISPAAALLFIPQKK